MVFRLLLADGRVNEPHGQLQICGVGWDVITFVEHERMFDATQQLGLGGVGCDNIRCT